MPDIQTVSCACPKCQTEQVSCKFNYFSQGDLQIHSWEHKCLDCGGRETTAYRSDDEDLDVPLEQRGTCPYCQRSGATG